MSISRTGLRNGLIVLAVFLLSLPVAEVAYRLAGAGPSADFEGLYREFGRASFRMNESLHSTADLFNGFVHIYTDELGLRCDAERRTGIAPGDSVRFLFLGDSQGFGNGVDYAQSVIGDFALQLQEEGSRAANLSIGGHYLDNQLELATWLTDEQQVRVGEIVLLATPRFLFKIGDYATASVDGNGRLVVRNPSPVVRIKMLFKSRSAVYIRLRNALQSVFGRGKDRSAAIASMYRIDRREARAKQLDAALEKVESWAESRRATVALAYLPLTIEESDGMIRQVGQNSGIETDASLYRDLLSEAADRHGMQLIDLSESLRRAEDEGLPLSLAGDAHYSEALSRICARQLRRQLVDANPKRN